MSSDEDSEDRPSGLELELYFLIAKFLSAGPCQKAKKALSEELQEHKLVPKRTDWEGREHFRSYENLLDQNKHIGTGHLLRICQRIGPLLEKEVPPSVKGVVTLLGAGRQSVLRTPEDVEKIHWHLPDHAALHHHNPLQPPRNLAHVPNMVTMLHARQQAGIARRDHMMSCHMFSHMTRLSKTLGHLSAVYCVSFDRTGEYIFTGADDNLVKIWHVASGRLISTLRGHGAEITDMAVSFENTLLATGSCDKFIRVWDLRTLSPVAVLHGHSGSITSLQFCPLVRGSTRFLASTGGDGCVCFWKWSVHRNSFDPKPIKFVERSRAGAQMLCSSFSPSGTFLATGSADHVVRVYSLATTPPLKIGELEAHCDHVDSIQYSHRGRRFCTGSRDGTARVWRYERQEWKCLVLGMALTLRNNPNTIDLMDENKFQFRVTMVGWTCDDAHVLTAVNDHTIKVWDSYTGELLRILSGHRDELFVLEGNPIDPRVILSAGHDGQIILWDIIKGNILKTYYNSIQGQGHGSVFDCKWAPDGLSFAATDSHCYLLYFGFGTTEAYAKLPEEMFFHTDYRPLIRDSNNYVLDEQTQQPPHLMPPPFLVDVDGNPHPPLLQRLVPGRERCGKEQLVPEMGETPMGIREVMSDSNPQPHFLHRQPSHPHPPPQPAQQEANDEEAPLIDHLINRLQEEQDQRIAASGGEPLHSPQGEGPLSPPPIRGPRRSGELEGVRQPGSNALVSHRSTTKDLAAIKIRVVVRELDPWTLRKSEMWRHQMEEEEIRRYYVESKKKPFPMSGNESSDSCSYMRTRKHKKHRGGYGTRVGPNEETTINRLTARALYDTEEETEETADTVSELMGDGGEEEEPAAEESDHMWHSDDDDNCDSSEYSDWTADAGLNLQPPKRQSQRRPKRKKFSSSEEDEDSEELVVDDEEEDYDMENKSPSPRPKKTRPPPRKKKRESKRQKQHKRVLEQQDEITELPEEFKPPEWLTETIPRKAPYFPQMGDEVIYFRQGHEQYVKAVQTRKAYEIDASKHQPWNKLKLREQELMKVIGIKYEIRPPRLVCLKLAFIDPDTSKMVGGTFSVKYHDMPDVIDFIVLRHTYDLAISRDWKVGDRFRSLIDNAWWIGRIESREPFQEEFPDSQFQCFNVHWDNSEKEKMSPWDLEPRDEKRLPRNQGGSVTVSQGELKAMMYVPKATEWPSCGRDEECERVGQGIDKIMELSIAEYFLAPVDLNAFPTYAMVIEYAVDLSTIKERLENRFYRRVSAIMYDIRHIENNAKAFNQPNSQIVKCAKLLTELCLRFINDTDCYDPMPFYAELAKDVAFAVAPVNGHVLGKSDDSEEDECEGTSTGLRRKQDGGKRSSKRRSSAVNRTPDAQSWKIECLELVHLMLDCEDSEPFRTPVDSDVLPDYQEIIQHPMDLGTVFEKLQCVMYSSPVDVCKDIRLVFNNSKAFNTNKRSRIYAMTLRLSAMFEEQMKSIIGEWKSALKYKRTGRLPAGIKKDCSKRNHKSTSVRLNVHRQSAASTSISPDPRPSTSRVRYHISPEVSGSSRSTRSQGGTPGVSSASTSPRKSQRGKGKGNLIDIDDEEDNANQELPEEEEEEDSQTESESEYEVNTRNKRRALPPPRKKQPAPPKSESESESKSDESDSDFEVKTRRKRPSPQQKKVVVPGSVSGSESEFETKSRKRKRPTPPKKAPSKKRKSKKLTNGSAGRYGTRCSTGSIKRKRYDRSDQEANTATNSSGSSKSDDSDSNSSSTASQASSDRPAQASVSISHDNIGDQGSDTEEYSHDEDDDDDHSGRTTRQSTRSSQRQATHRSVSDDFGSESHYSTRNQGRRTVQYGEDSDLDNGEEHESVSSRGRVRRLTPRARAIFS